MDPPSSTGDDDFTAAIGDAIESTGQLGKTGEIKSAKVNMWTEYHGDKSIIQDRRKRWLKAIPCMIRTVDSNVSENQANVLLKQLGVPSDSSGFEKFGEEEKTYGQVQNGDFKYSFVHDPISFTLVIDKKSDTELAIESNLKGGSGPDSVGQASGSNSATPDSTSYSQPSEVSSASESEHSSDTVSTEKPKADSDQLQAPQSYERQHFVFAVPGGLFSGVTNSDSDSVNLHSNTAPQSKHGHLTFPRRIIRSHETCDRKECWMEHNHETNWSNWFALSGYDGGDIFYQKTILNGQQSSLFLIEHKKSDLSKYKNTTEMLALSFKTR